MAEFLTNLFQSIFTAGPTPTLLLATNVSFAALQLVLLLLLIATYSVHFFILSILSGGLWWSINWFVAELRVGQQEEERKRKEREGERKEGEEDTETEVETTVGDSVVGEGKEGGKSEEIEVLEGRGDLRDRNAKEGVVPQVSKSETSTEDEWEKVSEEENEKDK